MTDHQASDRKISSPPPVPDAAAPALPRYIIHRISSRECFDWLAHGWSDYRKSGPASVIYGLIFVIAGFCMTVGLYLVDMLYLVSPMIGGFLLVGPILGIGLCEISRALQAGEKASLWRALTAFRRNSFHILTAGLVLMIFLMIWVRIAVLIFALTFPYTSINWTNMVTHALTSWDGFAFLLVGTAVGFLFAAVAFVFGVVSLPLMLDKREDIFRAGAVSFRAVLANRRPMAIWAALIVLFIGGGLATGYIGLLVTLPLIGHATWHAYRAMVSETPGTMVSETPGTMVSETPGGTVPETAGSD